MEVHRRDYTLQAGKGGVRRCSWPRQRAGQGSKLSLTAVRKLKLKGGLLHRGAEAHQDADSAV